MDDDPAPSRASRQATGSRRSCSPERTTLTSAPSDSSRRTVGLPRKPAPPVTTTRVPDQDVAEGFPSCSDAGRSGRHASYRRERPPRPLVGAGADTGDRNGSGRPGAYGRWAYWYGRLRIRYGARCPARIVAGSAARPSSRRRIALLLGVSARVVTRPGLLAGVLALGAQEARQAHDPAPAASAPGGRSPSRTRSRGRRAGRRAAPRAAGARRRSPEARGRPSAGRRGECGGIAQHPDVVAASSISTRWP